MIIDGKKLADKKLKELAAKFDGQNLHLASIVVSDDAGIKKFIKIKKKTAESIGISFSSYEFSSQAPEAEVLDTIGYLNRDPYVQGIFVELPLAEKFNRHKILDSVDPAKDVDVLTSVRAGRFYGGDFSILPPAVRALEMILEEYNIRIKEKKITVFGQGELVGKPITCWLKLHDAHVDAIDADTKNPEKISREADIIVSGVGKTGLITGEMVKDDAVVIDFGFPADVDFESVSKKASLITPTPGGTGPLVVAAVLENLYKLANY